MPTTGNLAFLWYWAGLRGPINTTTSPSSVMWRICVWKIGCNRPSRNHTATLQPPKRPISGASRPRVVIFGMFRVGNSDIQALSRPAQEAALCVPAGTATQPHIGPGLAHRRCGAVQTTSLGAYKARGGTIRHVASRKCGYSGPVAPSPGSHTVCHGSATQPHINWARAYQSAVWSGPKDPVTRLQSPGW